MLIYNMRLPELKAFYYVFIKIPTQDKLGTFIATEIQIPRVKVK